MSPDQIEVGQDITEGILKDAEIARLYQGAVRVVGATTSAQTVETREVNQKSLEAAVKELTGGYSIKKVRSWIKGLVTDEGQGTMPSVEALTRLLDKVKPGGEKLEAMDQNDSKYSDYSDKYFIDYVDMVVLRAVLALEMSNNPLVKQFFGDLVVEVEAEVAAEMRVKAEEAARLAMAEKERVAREAREKQERLRRVEEEERLAGKDKKVVVTTDKGETVPLIVDYRKDFQLGRGAISVVRAGKLVGGLDALRGLPHGQDAVQVAIKMRLKEGDTYNKPSFSKEATADFMTKELFTLNILREKQRELFPQTPSFVVNSQGVVIDGEPAIVMERIPRESAMFSYNQLEHMTQEQVQMALVEYFEALTTLHALDITCNDRKGGDLFYLPEQNRLVILDWNVTHTKESEGELKHQERRVADLTIGLDLFRGMERGYKNADSRLNHRALQIFPPEVSKKLGLLAGKLRSYPAPKTEKVLNIIRNIQSIPEEEILAV